MEVLFKKEEATPPKDNTERFSLQKKESKVNSAEKGKGREAFSGQGGREVIAFKKKSAAIKRARRSHFTERPSKACAQGAKNWPKGEKSSSSAKKGVERPPGGSPEEIMLRGGKKSF